MRTTVPEAFEMPFDSVDGRYSIRFRPIDQWDGRIDLSINGLAMQWDAVNADREGDGVIVLGGMTTGSEAIWGDQFWFELRLNNEPPTIQYWADKVIWRTDCSAGVSTQ